MIPTAPAGTRRTDAHPGRERVIQKKWPYSARVAAAAGRVLFFGVIVIGCMAPLCAAAADLCTSATAKVVSVQGNVEVRRASSAVWEAVGLNNPICVGDMLRVGERSRAGLLLSNETTLRLDQNTTLTVEAPDKERRFLLDVLTGVINVISRTPHPFRVKTPFVNANVEGTEFLVGVSENSARVAVYEGHVTAVNEQGSAVLSAGEIAIAQRNAGPRKEVMVRPRDAVQWALYYPTIIASRVDQTIAGTAGEAALRESIEHYRRGEPAEALAGLEKVPESARNPTFLVYRAGLLLTVGRVDEARQDIERVLALDPRAAGAFALQAVIAVVQDDKAGALKLASQAVELDPNSATARLALSYSQQAVFKIDDALASVQKAVDLDPNNALAWARLAELEMSVGDRHHALASAQRALTLNPELAKTQIVLGFAHLIRIDTRAAKTAFARAIELDQAEPLARLGLGLAEIREGNLHAGREQLEIATSLDPGNSLVRSYMGKAYYEEKRDKLAETQFELANQLDPNEPTPLFYGAILKQSQNRTVEAFQDVERSIDLNDNRAVYRSRLLLDEDRATQSAGLARIYQELGFEELALIAGAKALAIDPNNYAAHLFLADAYSRLPNEEIATESEQLQFLLRQPEIIAPVSALRADDTFSSAYPRTGIVRGIAPAQPAFSEFNSLFDRNKLSLYVDALGGQANTAGDQVIASGVEGGFSFNLAQAHFRTEGFGDNQDFRQNAYLGLVQGRLDPDTSVQAEVRQTDTKRGDSFVFFDPSAPTPVRVDGRVRSARIGGSHSFSPASSILVSAIYEHRDIGAVFLLPGTDIPTSDISRAYSAETQWSYSISPFNVVVGAEHVDGRDEFVSPSGSGNQDILADNIYAYGRFDDEKSGLLVQAGLSSDYLHESPLRRRRLSPKLGLIWDLTSSTTVRGALLRVVKRPLLESQTNELTQLGGFSQFFDEPDGTKSTAYDAAIDQKLTRDVHVGFEFRKRDLDVAGVTSTTSTDFQWRERASRAYMYWLVPRDEKRGLLPRWSLAMTAELQKQSRRRPVGASGDNIVDLDTTLVPLGLTIFPGEYLSLKLLSTYARQTGQIQTDPMSPSLAVDQNFWITDASFEFRVPGRRGIVAIGGNNLFNQKVAGYQEIDPAVPRFSQGRLLFARLIWQF